MRWTIGKKLFAGVGALLAVVLATAAQSVWAGRALSGQVEQLTDVTLNASQLAGRIQYSVANLRGRAGLIVIAAARKDTKTIEEQRRATEDDVRTLMAAAAELERVSVSDEVRQLSRAIQGTMTAWARQAAEAHALAARFKASAAMAANDAAGAHASRAETLAAQILQIEGEILRAERVEAGRTFARGNTALLVVVLIALCVSLAVVAIMFRINQALRVTASELRDGAERVRQTAAQVAGSAQSLSRGASEQAASLEETSASMEEMGSMTRRNAENTQQAAALMAEADHRVHGANQALNGMVASMASIRESSGKVAKIIKTIDEIAFQTNILALNAAVEAARAGEAGMGFAVVADEVRNLAQRSAQAARDTAALIEESIATAQQGSAKVDQVAASIGAITEGVARVKGLVDEVSVASRQQSQGIDQVSQAIGQMERVTQTTAATAEESAAASQELNGQAEMTLVLVARLEALVGRVERHEPAAMLRPHLPSKVVAWPGQRPGALGMPDAPEAGEQQKTGTFGSF